MPNEVTKSLEEELDEIDAVGEIYEDESEGEKTSDDETSDETKTDVETTEEESDGEKKNSEEESIGEETSEETDTSGEAKSDKKKEDEAGSETSEDLDGQQRIESLMTEIDRLSGLLVTQAPKLPVKSKEEDTTKTIEPSDETIEDFIGDLDMDDVASSPKVMNELLNKVLQKGIETGKSLSKNQTAAADATVSQTVATQVDSAIALKGMIDDFYDANPELVNVRQVVQACASQIVQDSPDKSFKDVLNSAADAARKTLGIPKSKTKNKIVKAEDVAFAEQKGGQRKKAKKASKLQQELDEL